MASLCSLSINCVSRSSRTFKREEIEGALFDLAAASNDWAPSDSKEKTEEGFGVWGSQLLLGVNGALGPYEGRLRIETDLDEDSNFYFPILLDTTSDLNSSRVSFLDFIFQFGFNCKSRVLPSDTREPTEAWSLSILPFGMFEFSKGVQAGGRNSKVGNRYTLFWFIDFGSV
ncbi:MAG: hypothetical protein ACI8TQ_004046 [Planctomycetota bacterium]|jgi:hypothetical protein